MLVDANSRLSRTLSSSPSPPPPWWSPLPQSLLFGLCQVAPGCARLRQVAPRFAWDHVGRKIYKCTTRIVPPSCRCAFLPMSVVIVRTMMTLTVPITYVIPSTSRSTINIRPSYSQRLRNSSFVVAAGSASESRKQQDYRHFLNMFSAPAVLLLSDKP